MSLEATYRGRRARVVDELVEEPGGWTGLILDYGDGLTFGVRFGDAELVVDPDDSEWDAASPMLERIPGARYVDLGDGTTGIVRIV